MLVVIGVPAQQVVTAVSTNKMIAPGRTKMAGWGYDSMIAGKINYKTQWTIIMLVTRTITHTGWVQTLAPPTSWWWEMKLFATITRISVIGHQNIHCDGVKGTFITNVINERPMQYKMSLNKRVLTSLICIIWRREEKLLKMQKITGRRRGG